MTKKTRKSPSNKEHALWLAKAKALAERPATQGGSPHPDVKVGAILLGPGNRRLAAAVNRMTRGVKSGIPIRIKSGERSLWINCAEQLAIADAARRGVKLNGARLYLTLEPCTTCAGLMIEAGVRELIIPAGAARNHKRLKPKWQRSIEAGLTKLKEAGVRVTRVETKKN